MTAIETPTSHTPSRARIPRIVCALVPIGSAIAVSAFYLSLGTKQAVIIATTVIATILAERNVRSTVGWTLGAIFGLVFAFAAGDAYAPKLLAPLAGGLVAALIIPARSRPLMIIVTSAAVFIGTVVGVAGFEFIGQGFASLLGFRAGSIGVAIGGGLGGGVAGAAIHFANRERAA